MKPIKLRITRVDLYGYNGRDYHPETSDIGLVVEVVKVETWRCPDDGSMMEVTSEDRMPVEDERVQVFEVRTEDGRTLELIDHEVEMIS